MASLQIAAMALAFAAAVALMFTRRLPGMLALPALAIALALIVDLPAAARGAGAGTAGGSLHTLSVAAALIEAVLAKGAVRLHGAAFTFIFGSIFAAFLDRSGIARDIIRLTAELSGERPRLTAGVLLAAVALLFTSLTGLGAIVMVGTIVLPLLTSLAIPADRAGALLLLGISLGGILNPANWVLYETVLEIPRHDVLMFALPFSALCALVGAAFILREISPGPSDIGPPLDIELPPTGVPLPRWTFPAAHTLALATPLIPLVLIALLGADPIAAFVAALVAGIALRPGRRRTDQLVACVLDGIQQAAPAVAVVTGLGMLIYTLEAKVDPNGPTAIAALIGPGVASLVPRTRLTYVLGFAIASPLALYRGPLNVWGMGMGLAGLLSAAGALHPMLLAAALLSVGQIQGIGDPTNTHNVWIAGFTSVPTRRLLVLTFPYALAMAVLGLAWAAAMYGGAL